MNLEKIKDWLVLQKSEKYKAEFHDEVIKIGLFRAKAIAIFLIVIEFVLVIVLVSAKKGKCISPTNLYYVVMYILMIITMAGYLITFKKLEKSQGDKYKAVSRVCYRFTTFILLWNVGISLLDQISYGQVISYITVIIATGLVSLLEPLSILSIYVFTQTVFVIFLPCFQKSSSIIFGNVINTTIAIMLAWIIQVLVYRNKVYDFNNKKIIEEKNNELSVLYEKLKVANEELKTLAERDGLTGVYNRMMFEKLLKLEWNKAADNHSSISLIMVDIDYFKNFNDSYGHRAGDDCIKKVANVLYDFSTDSSCFVARYGGEEFAIVINNLNTVSAFSIAEKLRKNVEKIAIPHRLSPIAEHVTISLGVYTIIPTIDSSVDKFIEMADNALYKAKNQNRNKAILG